MLKLKISIPLIILAFVVIAQPVIAADTLSLTVTTDKQKYAPSDVVNINGSLMWIPHMVPVSDGLVGVEVRDPAGYPFIFRTRPTGTITVQDWTVNFTQFYPCDSNGVPKYDFRRGETIWIFAEVKNFDKTSPHNALVCIVLYDPNSVPTGVWHPTNGSIPPNSSSAVFFQATTVSNSATLGNATLYASVYSDFPKDGGHPYCPERTATFRITVSGLVSNMAICASAIVLSSDGTYDVSFKFPPSGTRVGNYTVYASTYYYDTLLTNNVKFAFLLIGDINGDGKVNILDAILMSNAFLSTPGSPNWNPNADLNHDDRVNVLDAITLANHFGESAQ